MKWFTRQASLLTVVVAVAFASSTARACDPSEYSDTIDAAIQDRRAVESEVLEQWRSIDAKWRDTNLVSGCYEQPGGRACAMAKAIDAAKHNFDEKAWQIAQSTQRNRDGCLVGITGNSPAVIANYLRTK